MRTTQRRRGFTLVARAAAALLLVAVSAPVALAAHHTAADVVTVNFWNTSTRWLPKTLLDAFQRSHPNIKIKITIYGDVGNDAKGKLTAAIAGKRPPDLILAWDDSLAGWAGRGALTPLDGYLQQNGLKGSDYATPAWQSVQWQGKTYGVPTDWDPDALLWYNKDVFKSAGLDPNTPPRTWAEFAADAAKIDQVKGGKITRLGIDPWDGWYFNIIAYAHLFKSDLQSGSNKTVKLNDAGMLKALQWESDAAKRLGGASKVSSFAYPPNATGTQGDPLVSGRVGMYVIGDWEIYSSTLMKGGAAEFAKHIGIAPLPVPAGGQSYLSHSGWSFMVPHGAANAAAAMQFVAWMNQDQNIAAMDTNISWIPAKLSARSASTYRTNPIWQRIIGINKEAGAEQYWLLPSPVETQYYAALKDAESFVINLKKTPQQALADAQKVANQALQDALSAGDYGG